MLLNKIFFYFKYLNKYIYKSFIVEMNLTVWQYRIES